MLLSGADSNILQQIQYASIGITAFILCLLTQYIVQTLKSYRHSKFRVAAWFVILFVFIATGGNYLCRIFGLEIRLPTFAYTFRKCCCRIIVPEKGEKEG